MGQALSSRGLPRYGGKARANPAAGKPMKILYVTDEWSRAGGAQHHLRDVARAISCSASVRVAAGRFSDECPFGWTRVRCLSSKVSNSRGLQALEPCLEWADVIHVQNVMNPLALSRCTSTGKALVTVQDHRMFCPGMGRTLPSGEACDRGYGLSTCSGCLPEAGYRESMVALVRSRLEALRGGTAVVLSHYMAGELAGAGHPGAVVIPPWVELSPSLPASDRRGFLLAGRLVDHKDCLAAYHAWQSSGISEPLFVAGAGPLAGSMPLASRLGWLPRADLRRRMSEVRALLFPSRWQEPFGITGLEALASGAPVIACPAGGMGDWMGKGCISAAGASAMSDAMIRLQSSPADAAELSAAGRKHAQRHFSKEAIVPLLERLYRDLAGSGKKEDPIGF
jgi:hypothetical protein